jgi:hypothetical protein
MEWRRRQRREEGEEEEEKQDNLLFFLSFCLLIPHMFSLSHENYSPERKRERERCSKNSERHKDGTGNASRVNTELA